MKTGNLRNKGVLFILVFFASFLCPCNLLLGHCDTMDGPVIADAKKAIDQNNVNYVLIWVSPETEQELRDVFALSMKVRSLNQDAQALADRYFFETLVRIHRSGEGVPYTGVKPSGTPIDEKILAADKSIDLGNLSPLTGLVPEAKMPELRKRFDRVMSLKNFDVNDVAAGRKYVEAYVQFFHFSGGEAEEHAHGHGEATSHLSHIPWILSGVLFITSIVFALLYFRKLKK